MAIIKLLRSFEVYKNDKTSHKLEIIEGVVRSPKDSIILSFKKRELPTNS